MLYAYAPHEEGDSLLLTALCPACSFTGVYADRGQSLICIFFCVVAYSVRGKKALAKGASFSVAILIGNVPGCQLTLSRPHPSFLVEAGARLCVWEEGRLCRWGPGLCMATGVQAIASLCLRLNRYLGVPCLRQPRDSFALFPGQMS